MIVGVFKLRLFARGVHSLKEKRSIVLSIKEKLKHRFNISIIESDFQDVWQKIEISIAMITTVKKHLEKTFMQSEELIENNYAVEIIETEIQYF